MSTKVTLLIDQPSDLASFETAFVDVPQLASDLPGLERLESSKVWPKEDGSPTPAHRVIELYFHDYDSASRAVASPEAGAFFGKIEEAGGNFTGLFSDVEKA